MRYGLLVKVENDKLVILGEPRNYMEVISNIYFEK
jgi:hypothetical protein